MDEVHPSTSPAQDSLAVHQVSFDDMSPTEFEEFCRDVMKLAGFMNVNWRKGTPGDASPSDSGRDLEAEWRREDADGHQYDESWNVDAKHYTKSAVPPDALLSLVAWSHSSAPDVALVICSGYLSNPAKDWIDGLMAGPNCPSFRIRHWERPELVEFIRRFPGLLDRHRITVRPFRAQSEIERSRRELEDIVWYGRIQRSLAILGEDSDQVDSRTEQRIAAIEQRYPRESLYPWSSISAEFNEGRLAALSWAMGEEWLSELEANHEDGAGSDE